jgi:hypothetical protein
MEVIERVLVGGMKARPGHRVRMHKEKHDDGIKRGSRMYRNSLSFLRSAEAHRGDKLQLVKVRHAFMPKSMGMCQFRRKTFDVLNVQKHFKIPNGFKMKHVEVEEEVAEAKLPVPPEPDHLRTASLYAMTAIDSLFPKQDITEDLTASKSPPSVGEET